MKYIILLLSILMSTQVQAIKCYLTMVKGNNWKAYDLTVDLLDAGTGKKKLTTLIAEGDLWSRDEFECKPGETLSLEAKFSPAFWAGQEDKIYKGKHFRKLPNAIQPGEAGWNVTLCFPRDFSDVPSPPDANTNAECDLNAIPKIEPQKM